MVPSIFSNAESVEKSHNLAHSAPSSPPPACCTHRNSGDIRNFSTQEMAEILGLTVEQVQSALSSSVFLMTNGQVPRLLSCTYGCYTNSPRAD